LMFQVATEMGMGDQEKLRRRARSRAA